MEKKLYKVCMSFETEVLVVAESEEDAEQTVGEIDFDELVENGDGFDFFARKIESLKDIPHEWRGDNCLVYGMEDEDYEMTAEEAYEAFNAPPKPEPIQPEIPGQMFLFDEDGNPIESEDK